MTITNPTSGINTAYDLTTGIPINMDEAIYMISPDDSPLITGMNSDGLQVLPVAPTDAIRYDWLDEERLTPETTLASTATAGSAFITVASGQRVRFSTGDLVKVESITTDEIMQVTGYGTTTDTLTVSRGFAGTTAGSYASADKVTGLGTLLAEGSDPENARSADRTNPYNYTQIFGPTKVEMSRTEMSRRKYGVANEFTHQLMQRMTEDTIRRERAFLYGQRYNSTTTKYRTFGGLDYWITDNVDTTTSTLTETAIQSIMQTSYNNGGVPNILTANPARLTGLLDITNTSRVRTELTDPRRGRVPVTEVITEFGNVTLVRNRWCFLHNAFLWNREQATRRVFDPVRYERLAKTGDSEKAQIVCEEGFEFKGGIHAAKFSKLTS